jgi:hypothetical protein
MERRKARGLRADLIDLLWALSAAFDSYRPELHYMRGPGPKWHAKHDPAPVTDMTGMPALASARAH